jgi:hypothetical protein
MSHSSCFPHILQRSIGNRRCTTTVTDNWHEEQRKVANNGSAQTILEPTDAIPFRATGEL